MSLLSVPFEMVNLNCSCLSGFVLLVFCAFFVKSSFIEQFHDLNEKENFLISPYLLRTGLIQLYLGAQGKSAEELHLGIDRLSGGLMLGNPELPAVQQSADATFNIANKLFVAQDLDILEDYDQKINQLLRATIRKLNFLHAKFSVTQINEYVATRTKGKITTILENIEPKTAMILINAIYFKGIWKYQFNRAATKKRPFYSLHADGQTRLSEVDMMTLYGMLPFQVDEKFDIISLPYGESNISMLILLPKNDEELPSVFQMPKLALHPRPILFKFPKFKFEFKMDMIPFLRRAGINEIFDNANFKSMVRSSEPIKVGQVVQKCFIEVNEEGSTAGTMVNNVITKHFINIIEVNRPFTFMIVDGSTERIYFGGQVRKLGSA